MEAEEMGMVALIGLVLLPGVMWVGSAKGGGQVVLRSLVVGALLAGAVVLEASLDKTADSAVSKVSNG